MISQFEGQLPIPRNSVAAMVATYHDALAKIREACAAIHEQEQRIHAAFGEGSHIRLETRHLRFDDPKKEIADMDRWAWRAIVNVSGIRRILSVRATKEIDEQLDRQELPPITEANVEGFLRNHRESAGDHLAEAVREVHDSLRPTGDHYKRNSQYDIGRRVILEGWVMPGYGFGRPFRASSYRDPHFRALDNVFRLLDGKPGITTHYGDLANAIAMSDSGMGETKYFGFRACKNGNLHLEFRRPDLVAKLNAIAGGNRLYSGGVR